MSPITAPRVDQFLSDETDHLLGVAITWCHSKGVELVSVFEERASGGSPLDRRQQLVAAIDAVADENAGVFLVLRRDRLARDSIAAAMICRLVQRNGGRVVTTTGIGNGDAPEDELLRGLLDLFAQYERALIRARTRAGMAVKRDRGERIGRIPFGCRIGDDGRTLVEDPVEQGTISAMQELRLQGMTQSEIAAELNAKGHWGRSRNGRPSPWHQTAVGRFLRRFDVVG